MKIRTVINDVNGILSLGILLSTAYFMIKDTLSSKAGIKAVKYLKRTKNDVKEVNESLN